jgi:hypothetical protein
MIATLFFIACLLGTEKESLVTNMGHLVKRYLINTDYGERPFKIDVDWKEDLDQVYKTLSALHELSEQTIPQSIARALTKYTVRKNLPRDQVPSPANYESAECFYLAAYDYSIQLFHEGTIEIDLFDFVSEVCELNEVRDLTSEDWLDELADVTYLYLRLSMR